MQALLLYLYHLLYLDIPRSTFQVLSQFDKDKGEYRDCLLDLTLPFAAIRNPQYTYQLVRYIDNFEILSNLRLVPRLLTLAPLRSRVRKPTRASIYTVR